MTDFSTIIPAGAQERTRQLQWFEQTAFRNYVIPPTTDFANIGVVSSFSPTLNIQHKVTRVVGSRLQYSDRKLMKEGTFQIQYEMLDTKIPKYGMDDPVGALTIAKPLYFLETATINGATRYRSFKDAYTESISFAFDKNFIVTQNFYVSNVSSWMTEATLETELGITGTDDILNYFAPALTGEPWNHLDHEVVPPNTGSSLSVGADLFLFTAMTVEINNNLRKLDPSGYDQTKFIAAGNKEISGSITMPLGDGAVMENHVTNFDSNTVALKIKENTSNDTIMTLTGVKFNSMTDNVEAGTSSFSFIEYPFTCTQLTLPVFP